MSSPAATPLPGALRPPKRAVGASPCEAAIPTAQVKEAVMAADPEQLELLPPPQAVEEPELLLHNELAVAEALRRWAGLRADGMPPGSQTQEAVELRATLLAAARWRDVYA